LLLLALSSTEQRHAESQEVTTDQQQQTRSCMSMTKRLPATRQKITPTFT